MRCPRFSLLALLPLLAPVLGQDGTNSSSPDAYVAGLLSTLQGLNLTMLQQAAVSLANTTEGASLLASLPMGNRTVFAPNDAAFAQVPENVTSNLDELGNILRYHVVSGSFNASSFAMSPNHTIMRTFLNDSSLVQLEGNKSQVLVADPSGGPVMLLNQPQNITVLQSATYDNLIIHVIDGVLTVPPPLTGLNPSNISALLSAAQSSNLTDPVLASHGVTIFAPTDAALTGALGQLGQAASNMTLIQAVLGNHIVNGTTLYSTSLAGASNLTSASGEPLMMISNSSGLFVMSANSTAKVVQSDILIENGVVHLIDGVLLNPMSNSSAAESAYSVATVAAATQTAMETGAVGAAGAGSGATPSPSAGGMSSGALGMGSGFGTVGVAALAALAGAMLLV
ncbi:FAS1 domain-containing protein [Dacryopinax primogenitus]|uniref:FAS1 domain-containing protein n=1 Tax=Dacryopinax primogenitus (strain DJM 731) TaxID=1858805 RepID=M5G968_DACPD|nr:FAS1 domain-containing protein [Dacryopinax primogenitus]EJU04730.1 FAS1 domain-containing protein [Dacryopinax primogenitus]